MNWLDRVLASLRSAVRDLISEEDVPEDDRVTALLAAARVRIDALRIERDEATAREKRAALEGETAQAELGALNAVVDVALQAGQEAVAREQLARVQAAQAKADRAAERREAYAQVAARLRREVQTLQAQLDRLHEQAGDLADRERSVDALEQLNRLRRDLRQFAAATGNDLAEREEHAARREDRAAAREDIERDT